MSGPRHRGHFVPDTWVTLFAFCKREVWMPWKASSVMEERLRFVARLLDGEAKGGIGGLGHLSGVRRRAGETRLTPLAGPLIEAHHEPAERILERASRRAGRHRRHGGRDRSRHA